MTNQVSDDLSIVDLDRLEVTATSANGGKPAGVAVSIDSRRAFVTSPEGRSLAVIDTATRQIVRRIGPRAFGAFVRAMPTP